MASFFPNLEILFSEIIEKEITPIELVNKFYLQVLKPVGIIQMTEQQTGICLCEYLDTYGLLDINKNKYGLIFKSNVETLQAFSNYIPYRT